MDGIVPLVSVVMGVYNAESSLRQTLDSVLSQTFEKFEFIAVDDGSTDRTSKILQEYSVKDSRIKVIRQENRGLTEALIRGCAMARGEYIARQDAGDFSFPNRLSVQTQLLEERTEAVMVGCGTVFSTPQGEELFTSVAPGEQLDSGLRSLSISRIKGPPHHGGTMFRRRAYVECGGYRGPFQVAQDIDLWLRMSELGMCLGNPEILYRASIEPGSISILRGDEQRYFGELAIASAKLRRAGHDDSALFEDLRLAGRKKAKIGSRQEAQYWYFLASMLLHRDRAAARRYLARTLECNPWHLKARVRSIGLMLA